MELFSGSQRKKQQQINKTVFFMLDNVIKSTDRGMKLHITRIVLIGGRRETILRR